MIRRPAVLLILSASILAAPWVWGKERVPKGVSFDAAFGFGGAQIENPDQTKAHYKLLAVQARANLPLIEGDEFGALLQGGVKYVDHENTANSGEQSEVANMIGPGLGLQLRAYKFFVGYEYHMMFARHYTIGANSRTTKYEMGTGTVSAGLTIPLRMLAVSFSYSQTTGSVPGSKTGLGTNAPYEEQIYWVQLTYFTGAKLSQILGFLF